MPNNKDIAIKEPWWGAYKKYGWEDKMWGVGINAKEVLDAIQKKQKLKLNIWKFKTPFFADPNEVMFFAEKNNAKFRARNTMLYVVPEKMLQKYKPEIAEEV